MRSKKRRSRESTDKSTFHRDQHADGAPAGTEEPSGREQDPVDLGDFTAVWKYLASHPSPVRRTNRVTDVTVEDKLAQKASALENSLQLSIPPENPKHSALSAPARKAKKKNDVSSKGDSRTRNGPSVFGTTTSEENEQDSTDSDPDARLSQYSSYHRRSFVYNPPATASASNRRKSTSIIPSSQSSTERHRSLIEKLISKFPDQSDQIFLSQSESIPGSSYLASLTRLRQSTELHIFVDNSNILIGFNDTYKEKRGLDPLCRHPKFDFLAFSAILERGRQVSRKFLVGSNPLTHPVPQAEELGYEVSMLERVIRNPQNGNSGNSNSSDSPARSPKLRERKKEQAVDEILHLKILECLLDAQRPGTIVLATGDAAPAEFSRDGGFLKCIQRALVRAWHVELICWRKSMSRLWRDRDFRMQYRDTFTVVELDDFVDELVLE
jgi:hypothetical protein